MVNSKSKLTINGIDAEIWKRNVFIIFFVVTIIFQLVLASKVSTLYEQLNPQSRLLTYLQLISYSAIAANLFFAFKPFNKNITVTNHILQVFIIAFLLLVFGLSNIIVPNYLMLSAL